MNLYKKWCKTASIEDLKEVFAKDKGNIRTLLLEIEQVCDQQGLIDPDKAKKILEINVVAATILANDFVELFEQRYIEFAILDYTITHLFELFPLMIFKTSDRLVSKKNHREFLNSLKES